jgi:transcriptional regulator with XRE-family HTH domain
MTETWLQDPAFRAECDKPDLAFDLSLEISTARARSGLTQGQIAERMGTTQSAVARLESGRAKPSLRTLEKYAAATGSRLKVVLEKA